jgi:hypothetical protein
MSTDHDARTRSGEASATGASSNSIRNELLTAIEARYLE